jgi:gliding motility-associated-like protein
MVNNVPLGGTRNGIDFTGGFPQPFHFSNPPYNFTGNVSASNAVCNTAGQPLFFTNGRTVYDRNGQVMPNGSEIIYPTGGTGYSMPPIIHMLPGQGNRYAVFTQRNGGLYYSLVDMDANNALGAIMPQQKNISLNSFVGRSGITMNAKAVSIQGCSNNWLVYRSRYAKEFRSFAVRATGVQPTPVISEVGLLPVGDYEGHVYQGVLKASPDGRTLVIVAKGAIELFDFNRCSGEVINPMLVADDGDYYYGLCFSPDNSKLYATTREWPGKVYQFDLSLPTAAAVRLSKTLVFTNTAYWVYNLYWFPSADVLNDIKSGPDGKLYFTNGFWGAQTAHLLPTTASPAYSHRLHVINEPNRAGLACNAVADILTLPGPVGIDWPPDIVLPPRQDTLYGGVRQVTACFRDSILLQADTPGSCYRWDDGSDHPAHMASRPGIYSVQYTDKHCILHIDSFDVAFVQSPHTGPATYSCPNEQKGSIAVIPATGDTTLFDYFWKDNTHIFLRTQQAKSSDTLSGITSGKYSVHMTTTSGCDTTLYADVLPLPLPPVSYEVDTIVCKGMPLSFTHTSEAPVWNWFFGDGSTTDERHPQHIYPEAGIYKVLLVAENLEGCRDTATKNIRVKDLQLSLTATPGLLNRGETVSLQTHAPEPYRITMWLPEAFFADQSAYRQLITIDTTRIFTITGQSEYGCADTASVWLTIHPRVFLPTAFTPNGDGQNDYFRPAVSGEPLTIYIFRIFDRWGHEVWSGQGSAAATGWDGMIQGTPAELGVYFYTIEAETHTGKTIRQQGDVTLLR